MSGTRSPLPTGPYGFVKRLTDVVIAAAGLVLLSPLLAAVWLIIRIETRGPGLFVQRRIGRFGEEFEIVKFRTMTTDAPDVATADFPTGGGHVTRFGAVLRRTSIDELPQLWNVLTGEMSVVGPRPALWSQYGLTGMRQERGVLALRPGLTGLAQVSGRDDLDLDVKVDYDEEYLRTVGLAADVRIVWRTLAAAMFGRGAR